MWQNRWLLLSLSDLCLIPSNSLSCFKLNNPGCGFQEWKLKKDEEMKAELSQNSRYKSYRRYLKKGGPGQISFGPD